MEIKLPERSSFSQLALGCSNISISLAAMHFVWPIVLNPGCIDQFDTLFKSLAGVHLFR